MKKFTILVNTELDKEKLWDSITEEIPKTEVVDIFESK